jgi:hypothetical protein
MTLKPEADRADEEGMEPLAPPVPMADLVDLVAPPQPAPPPVPSTELVPARRPAERYPEPLGTTSTALGPVLPRRRSRKPLLAGALAAVLIAGGALAATGTLGGSDHTPSATGGTGVAAAPGTAKTAGAEDPTLAPLPKAHPKVVQPIAGETSDAPTKPVKAAKPTKRTGPPQITGPATVGGTNTGDPGVRNLQADKATALPNGVALPPLEAPSAVLDVIRAGNIIARTPYKWGGGHGRFQDNGYDCSGSVSYALYYAGLLNGPHTSGELMAYGKPGPGKWITIYASPTHVYMTVAGIGFDTSAANAANHESRWRNDMRSNAGFEVRHPDGL